MEADFALFLVGGMLKTALLIATPILATSLGVGLLISIFQVVTQIQEMTLTFVPKIIAAVGALALFGPWMMQVLMDFSRELIENIPAY